MRKLLEIPKKAVWKIKTLNIMIKNHRKKLSVKCVWQRREDYTTIGNDRTAVKNDLWIFRESRPL